MSDHDAARPSPGLKKTDGIGQAEPGSRRSGASEVSRGSGSQAVRVGLGAGDAEERGTKNSEGAGSDVDVGAAGSAGSGGGVEWKERQTLRAQVRC